MASFCAGGNAGAVDRLVDAGAAGGVTDLLQDVGIGGIEDRLCAQLQREFAAEGIALDAEDGRAAGDAIDDSAEADGTEAEDEHGVGRLDAHVLHRAESRAEAAAGHGAVIIGNAGRQRKQQPVLLDQVLCVGGGAGLGAANLERVDAVLTVEIIAGDAHPAFAAGIAGHDGDAIADP